MRHHPVTKVLRLAAALAVAASAALAGCAGPGAGTGPVAAAPPDYAAIVAAPDRAEGDRVIDKRRNQPQLLAFIGPRAGMRVLDVSASAGYTTELLARAVGPTGGVFAQDASSLMERSRARMDERMRTPAMARVVRVTREFEDPVPPGVGHFDLVTFLFSYHDVAYGSTDRARMNRRLFEALRPGGVLVVADHAAATGAGTGVARTLHRIEESVVRGELEAAGFRLVEEGHFLRSPADTRDTVVFRSPVPVDEFVLKFVRP